MGDDCPSWLIVIQTTKNVSDGLVPFSVGNSWNETWGRAARVSAILSRFIPRGTEDVHWHNDIEQTKQSLKRSRWVRTRAVIYVACGRKSVIPTELIHAGAGVPTSLSSCRALVREISCVGMKKRQTACIRICYAVPCHHSSSGGMIVVHYMAIQSSE